MSSKIKVDIKTLLEAGAHFGHKTSRWNPKMSKYIHSKRGGIHIIDLEQTLTQLEKSANFLNSVAASGKKILFVGTKKHIAPTIQEVAEKINMPYVTERWMGGMLTNFTTISERVKRLKQLNEELESGELSETYNKREILEFSEERDKLAQDFGGIMEMDGAPGAVFVSDVITEKTAIREAKRLKIPIVAIVDSNGDPTIVDYPIPANDDALKTIELITSVLTEAIAEGSAGYSSKPRPKEESSAEPKQVATKPNKETEVKTKTATKTNTKKPATTKASSPKKKVTDDKSGKKEDK
ncbi:MAG: 30S ribosomal protein S2 [Candidatus Saccharimonadales bacterium]